MEFVAVLVFLVASKIRPFSSASVTSVTETNQLNEPIEQRLKSFKLLYAMQKKSWCASYENSSAALSIDVHLQSPLHFINLARWCRFKFYEAALEFITRECISRMRCQASFHDLAILGFEILFP